MRLNKYLSESGQWSRREADRLIEEGRVTINGTPAPLGAQVAEGDDVSVDGDTVGGARKKLRPVYIALNKPAGITCTTERTVDGNIVDFVDHPERVFPIGRLDKDSEGLILLTNDGDIVNEVLRAENGKEKEYLVVVDKTVSLEDVTAMAAGVKLSAGEFTKRCKIEKLGPKAMRFTLTQGLNRQIRRMCGAFGYEVEALQRVRIMHIQLGHLAVGRWRNLTPQELEGLMPKNPPPKPQPQKPQPQKPQPQKPQQRPGGRPGGGRPDNRGRRR